MNSIQRWIYVIFVGLVIVYTWSHIDLNFTLINAPWWDQFRNAIIQLAYYHRILSTILFILIIGGFTYFHYIFLKQSNKKNLFTFVLAMNALLGVFAYNFLSYDIFNYIFDAKIVTFYHQNPYIFKPLDFPNDGMLRFMHWVHRTYPYGPTFLLITLVPSFLSFGKFILAFFLFKIMWIILYLYCAQLLYKKNHVWGMFFATSPLVLIEGLINAHNDFIGVCFMLIAVFALQSPIKYGLSLFSAGIKFATLPGLLSLWFKQSGIGLILMIIGISYLIIIRNNGDVFPWYFLNFFIFLPYYPKLIEKLSFLFTASLLGYTQFVLYGNWWWQISPYQFLIHTIIQYSAIACGIIIVLLHYKHEKQNI